MSRTLRSTLLAASVLVASAAFAQDDPADHEVHHPAGEAPVTSQADVPTGAGPATPAAPAAPPSGAGTAAAPETSARPQGAAETAAAPAPSMGGMMPMRQCMQMMAGMMGSGMSGGGMMPGPAAASTGPAMPRQTGEAAPAAGMAAGAMPGAAAGAGNRDGMMPMEQCVGMMSAMMKGAMPAGPQGMPMGAGGPGAGGAMPMREGLQGGPAMPMRDGMQGGPAMPMRQDMQGGATPAQRAFRIAGDRMHAGMAVGFGADPDEEFVFGMIAHHRGAIEMAEVVLLYGEDPEIRRLAQQIITDQEAEVATMRRWLIERRDRRP